MDLFITPTVYIRRDRGNILSSGYRITTVLRRGRTDSQGIVLLEFHGFSVEVEYQIILRTTQETTFVKERPLVLVIWVSWVSTVLSFYVGRSSIDPLYFLVSTEMGN